MVLAHPYKTRLIADAQIKTDRLDAFALGTLCAGNWWRGPHSTGHDPCAQESLAATTLLGAVSHHAAQPHPCLARSTARVGVAAMLGHLWGARLKLPLRAGTSRAGPDPAPGSADLA